MYDQKSALKYRAKNKDVLNAKQREKYQELKRKNVYINVVEKMCSSCHKNLPKEKFKILFSSKDCLTYTCKDCINKNNNSRKNHLKRLLRGAKERSHNKNLSFDLTLEFLEEISNIETCPVFKTKLEWEYNHEKHGIQKNLENRPSIDRIDSSKGYTKDNVKIISWKANRLKNVSNQQELLMLLNYVTNNSKLCN